ncbi:MAG: chorismate mutase [Candidatus Micrarchaeota archaeon]|nr:chorismate mutase [Candidatus Micrarchaeota archaeon]
MDAERIIARNRRGLDRINVSLVRLIAERDRLVVEIGRAKKRLGLKITDRKREKAIMDKIDRLALHYKVDKKLARRIVKTLIRHAKELQ